MKTFGEDRDPKMGIAGGAPRPDAGGILHWGGKRWIVESAELVNAGDHWNLVMRAQSDEHSP